MATLYSCHFCGDDVTEDSQVVETMDERMPICDDCTDRAFDCSLCGEILTLNVEGFWQHPFYVSDNERHVPA